MKNKILSVINILSCLFIPLIIVIGCATNKVELTFRSEPGGARVYNTNDAYLGQTPFTINYEVPDELYDAGNNTWNLGYIKAHLDGYEPKTQEIVLDISNHIPPPGVWDVPKKGRPSDGTYRYNFLITFNSNQLQHGLVFYTANTGNDTNPRDAFRNDESIEIVLNGYSGKTVELYIKNISNGETAFPSK